MSKFFLAIAVILFSLGVTLVEAGNLGHRGGCKLAQQSIPAENSLKCLEFVKKNLDHPDLDYLEFDVWEAREGLIVMHGGNI